MAEHRFTPGPWELDAPGNEHVVDYDYHVIQAGDGFHDTRTKKGFRLSGYMSIADGRLMATTPKLLNALIALYAVARVDRDEDYGAVTNAAAVIAEATGAA